jgi:hypothetical protein
MYCVTRWYSHVTFVRSEVGRTQIEGDCEQSAEESVWVPGRGNDSRFVIYVLEQIYALEQIHVLEQIYVLEQITPNTQVWQELSSFAFGRYPL